MVTTGLERLVQQQSTDLADRKVGLLCHHASFTSDLVFAADALTQAGARVERLLGPEHGLWGTAQDMIPVDGGVDRWTGREVVSLYGSNPDSLRPEPSVFDDLDLLVIDLQDVGARYYTYACTAAFAAEVAVEAGLEVIICDRPNPIGGARTEGNLLQPDCASFVGMFPVPQRHGLTIAELVLATTTCDLTVIPMDGWRRDMWFDETGLPWIPPSPNMPTLGTAALYPGLCLLEGTTLSEGRGTSTPFELFGAPFVDPFVLASELNDLGLPGVLMRPHVFEPKFQKHARQECGGVQLIVTQRDDLQPVRLGVAILTTLHKLWPDALQWRTEVYEFVSDRLAIDLLLGDMSLRPLLENGASWEEVTASWSSQEDQWNEECQQWLLYE